MNESARTPQRTNRLRTRPGLQARRYQVNPEGWTEDVEYASAFSFDRGRAREYCVNIQMKNGSRALVCFTSRALR